MLLTNRSRSHQPVPHAPLLTPQFSRTTCTSDAIEQHCPSLLHRTHTHTNLPRAPSQAQPRAAQPPLPRHAPLTLTTRQPRARKQSTRSQRTSFAIEQRSRFPHRTTHTPRAPSQAHPEQHSRHFPSPQTSPHGVTSPSLSSTAALPAPHTLTHLPARSHKLTFLEQHSPPSPATHNTSTSQCHKLALEQHSPPLPAANTTAHRAPSQAHP